MDKRERMRGELAARPRSVKRRKPRAKTERRARRNDAPPGGREPNSEGSSPHRLASLNFLCTG